MGNGRGWGWVVVGLSARGAVAGGWNGARVAMGGVHACPLAGPYEASDQGECALSLRHPRRHCLVCMVGGGDRDICVWVWGIGRGELTTLSYCPQIFGRGCARLALWAGRSTSWGLHAPLVRPWR